MANYYQNPYANYPYSGFNNYPQQQYQQPMVNQIPFTIVDNINDVRSYLVQPNQVVYIKLRNANVIYEKSANSQGEYSLNEYIKAEPKEEPKVEYVSMESFKALEDRLAKLEKQGDSNE